MSLSSSPQILQRVGIARSEKYAEMKNPSRNLPTDRKSPKFWRMTSSCSSSMESNCMRSVSVMFWAASEAARDSSRSRTS